jgi:hypothetical protein
MRTHHGPRSIAGFHECSGPRWNRCIAARQNAQSAEGRLYFMGLSRAGPQFLARNALKIAAAGRAGTDSRWRSFQPSPTSSNVPVALDRSACSGRYFPLPSR